MKVVFLLLLLFSCKMLHSQDMQQDTSELFIECSRIANRASLLFEKYYGNNQMDSAKIILKYWNMHCGGREVTRRAEILIALKEHRFSDSIINYGFLSDIEEYQARMKMIKSNDYSNGDGSLKYYDFIPVGQAYDKFTINGARALKNEYKVGSNERLLCELYSEDDSLFYKIQHVAYKDSKIYKEYFKEVNQYINRIQSNVSVMTGVWVPTGELVKLGKHPGAGCQLGLQHKKMSYDLTMCFYFLNSANFYDARRVRSNGNVERTNHFLGGYFGIDVGRDIAHNDVHELKLLAGIGLDGFDALKQDKNNNIAAESIMTYNFNFGLGYRYFIDNSIYMAIHIKYNIVNYAINHVIDFTGNPVTVQLLFGVLTNRNNQGRLKDLKYNYR